MSNELKSLFHDYRWRDTNKLFLNNIYRFNYTELFGLQEKWEISRSVFLICFDNNFLFILFYSNFCWTKIVCKRYSQLLKNHNNQL